MQHPYINFGPMQQQQQDEDGTMPPALPPKRSSRSHPGSFRSDGIVKKITLLWLPFNMRNEDDEHVCPLISLF